MEDHQSLRSQATWLPINSVLDGWARSASEHGDSAAARARDRVCRTICGAGAMSIHERIRKDGTKVYDARVRDVHGKEVSRTFPNKTAARRFSEEWRVDRDRGLAVRPGGGRRPFGEVAREWMASNPTKKANTVHTDNWIIENRLRSLLDRRIGSIERSDVQKLVNEWAAAYKPSSVARYFAVLRAIFNLAVDNNLIGKSPCRGIKRPRIERVRRPGTLTPADIGALCEAVGPHYRCLILFMAETGARPEEAFGLRVGNVNLMEREPFVNIVETLVEVKGRLVAGPPKSEAGSRTLLVSSQLAGELAAHMARRGVDASMPTALVFTTPSGAPLRSSNFDKRVWNPARVAAGVAWAVPYDMRRMNATAMFDEGVDVSTAQKRMGHADPRLTLSVYAQRSTTSDQQAATRLGNWLANTDAGGGGPIADAADA